jgi:UDP-N-acetylmuramate--alanine ligase
VVTIEGPEDLPAIVGPLAKPGGAIVFLGAGSITQWAASLEAALSERSNP